ncbi:sensor histidine kinase [Streptococcus sp. DD13]|uniref:sensor histidine kinase n=1 Tax=Streptococcus sp. DD13 TaxID=1777881 RepID=UPI000793FE21|nr:sensor histidine kinase [Streptococcus sp. DD13]KXT78781.1 Signal transduction histidine kinase [Streptococcus sp. DD13]
MIGAFFKEYRIWFIGYLIQVMGFLVIFYLYQLPLPFFLYSLIFASTIWSFLLVLQLTRFYKRIRLIQDIHEDSFSDLNLLQQPIDQAYLDKITQLSHQQAAAVLALQKRDKERQEVVRMWAHQLKVPLAALSLMQQTERIDPIEVKGQLLSMNHYLSNLLNYLRLTDQVSDYRFTEVEVRSLVVDLVKQYRIHFLQKQLTVDIQGNWHLKTDKKWLFFALSQVLDNAIKYNPPGGHIQIDLTEEGLMMADSGVGILPEDLPRLFERGFTGLNGRQYQKSTGFGLFMTKRVLTDLALDITVESELDQGTRVYIKKLM